MSEEEWAALMMAVVFGICIPVGCFLASIGVLK